MGTLYGDLSPSTIFDQAINDSIVYLISIFGLLLITVGFISLGAESLVQPIVLLTERFVQS